MWHRRRLFILSTGAQLKRLYQSNVYYRSKNVFTPIKHYSVIHYKPNRTANYLITKKQATTSKNWRRWLRSTADRQWIIDQKVPGPKKRYVCPGTFRSSLPGQMTRCPCGFGAYAMWHRFLNNGTIFAGNTNVWLEQLALSTTPTLLYNAISH